ncbi:MAG: hemerythrin family protein [Chlorobi bacterium]|nr:hemerythrin family protein [Chlorobiota bacterium]
MKEYINYHFNTEETLLREYGYPDLEKHKLEHKMFVSKVEEFENRFNSGKLVLSLEITGFLKSWLKDHIQGADKDYSKFLTTKGAK